MTNSMTDRRRRYFFTTWVTIVMVLLGLAWASRGDAQETDGKTPVLLDMAVLQIEAVEATYVSELRGANASYKAAEPTKLRGLVLTLRIRKPVDTPLRLYPPDFVLHYTRQSGFDVIPCTGLSAVSIVQGVNRPMTFADRGYLSVVTGNQGQKSGVL